MWTRGDQIVLRYRDGERITSAAPVTVVEDTDAYVAFYLAVGTPVKLSVGAGGLPIPRSLPYEERSALPWQLGDGHWQGHSQLWLVPPGVAHAIGCFWREADYTFAGWYVDLQAPLARTRIGFDTVDHVLDIVASPDLIWQWKDDDEFAAAQRLGHFSPAEAATIRAEGEAVIETIEQCSWPFNAGWEVWRPDPRWPLPELPHGWDAA